MDNIIKPGTVAGEKREQTQPDAKTSKFTLTDLADEWHFFTHGALFAFAEFKYPDEDPIADWYVGQPRETVILNQPFAKPVFEGLDRPTHIPGLSWNHIVCAVRKEWWQSLFEFLGGVCSVNSHTDAFYSVFSGDITILDPGMVDRYSVLHPNLPQVTVTVFCVDGNRNRWEVRPPAVPTAPPRFVKMPPTAAAKALADAAMSGDIEALRNRENPAFQDHLDKYQAVRERGPIIEEP